ncbi:MAG TPA: class I SAM-dependent methyltransferase [Spirochaetota bacterium]|nr:class I SAM-dependent methyltransferase [Spirochaetota bacterium]
MIKNTIARIKTKFLYKYFDQSGKFKSGLIDIYKKEFKMIKYKKIKILEIGVENGGSLLFWSDYFKHPGTRITGIDIVLPRINFPNRVTVKTCNQNDSEGLTNIAEEFGPFDIILDDASHYTKETKKCFDILFNYLSPEGLYIIEDWSIGYLRKKYYSGMVEFVTEIINKAPDLKIDYFKISWDAGSTAIFRKKGLKEQKIPDFIKNME